MKRIILVPIDYSDVTDAVLDEARRLAGAFDAVLHLVHAAMVEPAVYSTYQTGFAVAQRRKSKAQMLQEAAEQLVRVAETCRPDVRVVTTSVLDGHAGLGIMEEARRLRPMMIVLGSHGHGALHHLLTGSVCEYVMAHSLCPVLIVPSRVGTYEVDLDPAQAATMS